MNAEAITPPAVKTKAGAAANGDVKAPKAPKVKKEGTGINRSNFAKLYPNEATITLKVEKNPKKPSSKSHTRFEGYFKSKTVAEALANGVTYGDIAYDVGRGFISVA